MAADLCVAYVLMLISMTLTLTQGHSGLAEENYLSHGIQTVHGGRGRFMHDILFAHACFDDLGLDPDFENVCKAHVSCFLIRFTHLFV